MRLAAGLLLVGLWGCIPELQPPSSGQPTTPPVQPTSSVIMEPTVSPQPSSVLPVPLVSAELWAGHPEQTGFKDGQEEQARFGYPNGLALDPLDNLYVADASNQRIRKITPNGNVITIAGGSTGYSDGPALKAQMNLPYNLIWLPNGDVWFHDNNNFMIRKLTPDGQVFTIIAASLPSGYTGVQPPSFPVVGNYDCWGGSMSLGSDSQVYGVSEDHICRIEANGRVTKMVGKVSTPDYAVILTLDGPAKDSIIRAGDLVFDPQGNIYISDRRSHLIRKISKDWSTITTAAGDAKACQEQYDKLTACKYIPPEKRLPGQPIPLNWCEGACANGHRDGPAKQALFNQPEGLVLDPQGNLYIADSYNHAIRKLSTDGIVSTVVKLPDKSFPKDIVRDKQGNFYVSAGHAIYKFRVP